MDFVTTGDIARQTHADRDAVSYALRRANIQPIGRAGMVRLFTPDSVDRLRGFLKRKRQRKAGSRCSA